MIREVLRMGDPRLLKKASKVQDINAPEIRQLLKDMRETMAHMNGAGLAAPQIGVDLQVVIFGVTFNPRYPSAGPIPYTELINPELFPASAEMEEGWEGCLSLPGLRGLVPRHVSLRYTGYDANGNLIDRSATGFHARVVQHECDHLDGVLYPMRIRDFSSFGFAAELFPDQEIFDT